MKPTAHKPRILSNNLFPVIGIGASAGGLEAFKTFIKNIPLDSGMAFVLVQHLDPNHRSILPQILQKASAIPVVEISDDIEVKPDHIYIIPSNKTLKANDGVLELTERPKTGTTALHLPIDIFFRSLAEIHREHAIGVIMSGNASDGTKGIKAIKDAGGLTFAQDVASAANDSMPRNAIASGMVDYVLDPGDILKKLLELRQSPFQRDPRDEGEDPQEESLYTEILGLVRLRKDMDFTHYKRSTIRRRIAKRISENKLDSVKAYRDLLSENVAEQDALYQDMLIPVTGFFRDSKVFDLLCTTVFPHIVKTKKKGEPIRMWVAGCSTGQEAYSMAMCLSEFLGNSTEKIHVFATDISEPAISKARKGVYTEAEVEDLSDERIKRFFTRKEGKYYVNKDLRDKCVFATHDFLTDAPFGKLEFVSCRNVLIYMDSHLQKNALTTFHYSLHPNGYLLLGKSESVSVVPSLFSPADVNNKLFSRNAVAGNFLHVARSRRSDSFATSVDSRGQPHADFSKAADVVLLTGHTPAGVVVNDNLEVVEYRGATSIFLEVPKGKPSHNLLKISRAGLGFELRVMIQKARKGQKAVSKAGIQLSVSGKKHHIAIDVIPLPGMLEPHFLVLFKDNVSVTAVPKSKKGKETGRNEKLNEQHILRLEKELAQNRHDMDAVAEEQETVNQDLQSANEELLSANEELQSLNEELETSKEELQSTNEELSNLNEQLNTSREYSDSIVDAVREPVLVLDKQMRIRTANRAFYGAFHVTKEETENVLIYELGNKQWNIPALRTLLEEIMPERMSFEGFEVKHNFNNLGERIMLLNAREMIQGADKERLILLAIEDITEQSKRLLKKKELLTRFQNLVMQAPVAMCILKGQDLVVEVANEYYLTLVGRDKRLIDRPFFDSLPELKSQKIEGILEEVLKTGSPYFGFEEDIIVAKNGHEETRYFNSVYQPIREPDQAIGGIIIVVAEVTDQVVARKRMEVQAEMARNLIMTAPGFVCTLVGPDHVYALVNDRYQQLFGNRRIQGRPIMEALPELAGQGFDTVLNEVYKTGSPYVGFDIPITLSRDEGLEPELRYFNFSYQPMYNDSKEVYSILVFGYEVTEQVVAKNRILEIQTLHAQELEDKVQERTVALSNANYQLLLKNEQLRKMNHELESFNYVSSHDLQEPLRKIQLFSSFILNNELSALTEKGQSNFKGIIDATVRMRTLINDLLAYSMTDLPNRKFEMTDLNILMEEVRAEMAETLKEKKIELEVGEMCNVALTTSQFRQLFFNLIGNSVKYARPNVQTKIKITCRILTWEELKKEIRIRQPYPPSGNQGFCCITVSDNGIGFDPTYNEQVFEVFQRLHNRDQYSGNGIGLAIVKKTVEAHHGFITANGRPGDGADFRIYLPM